MNRRTLMVVLMAALCIVLASALVVAFIVLSPGYGPVPMSEAPGESSAVASDPMPTITAPAPSLSPTVAPTPKPSESAESMQDIPAIPVHITIWHGSEKWVDTGIVSITLDGSGMLVPPAGEAGVYYSKRDWDTIPGNLDRYRGIIAGHDVTGMGAKDVFYNLGNVKKGDLIALTYRLHSGKLVVAEFTVTADAKSAPKTDVIHAQQYQYLWQPMAQTGRYMSVLSCDLSKAAPGQHSRNNWIVDAVRTK